MSAQPTWDMTAEDFRQLRKLDKACEQERERIIQRIMIEYFERRSAEVYHVAQLMMARVHYMEVP